MKADVAELTFKTRSDFRSWLADNAEASGGVWLVFCKDKSFKTLSANEALEEALCFGWIDGQMKSIDEGRYHKYFAQRRDKSPWSEKNKKTAEELIEKKLMTKLGLKAIQDAKKNGNWEAAQKREPISEEQVNEFAKKLKGFSPACENFNKMSPSVRRAYTGRFLSFKTEEGRQRDFFKIIERLNQNLKPM